MVISHDAGILHGIVNTIDNHWLANKSEPSDKPPELIKASFTLFKYYDNILIAF